MKCFLISDNVDTLTGMKLAGIDGIVLHEKREASEKIWQAVSDETVAVLAVTEKIAEFCPEEIDSIRKSVKRPLVVIIPDRHGSKKDSSILNYINDSVGLGI